MSSLRILRNGAKIKQLTIPADKVESIKYIQKTFFGRNAAKYLKQLLGHSPCCCCHTGVPSIEVSWDLGGATKIEYYCDSCKSFLYEKQPTDQQALASKYNCIAVDELPKTPGYKDGKEVIS